MCINSNNWYNINRSELFGPKVIRQITSNIEISGPISFTKTFDMQLPIPPNICPTVDESGLTFKIDYSLRVSINLNEQNPHRPETAGDIVIFNVPFVIGTYPKVAFNIDDDDDDEEDNVVEEEYSPLKDDSSNSFEYDQVAEKMKDLDLGSEINSPTLLEQSPSIKHSNSITHIHPTLSSPQPSFDSIQEPVPEPAVNKPDEVSSHAEILSPPLDRILSTNSNHLPMPKLENTSKSGEGDSSSSPTRPCHLDNHQPTKSPSLYYKQNLTTNTPPLEHSTLVQPPTSPSFKAKLKISPSEIYNDYQPMVSPIGNISPTSPQVLRHDSVASLHPSHSTTTVQSNGGGSSTGNSGIGRQESVRWIVRNQEAPTPALVSPQIPPRPSPTMSSHGGFVMPTPSFSESTSINTATNSPPYHHNHYQQGHTHNYGTSPPQHTQHQFYNHNNNSMPMPQQQPQPQPQHHHQPPPHHHQFPPYINDTYQYPNANSYHPQPQPSYPQYDPNGFPQPQPQPQPFSGGFMGMPSHQTYQAQPQYPFYNN